VTRFEVQVAVAGLEAGAFDVQGLRPAPGTVLMRKRGVLTPAQMGELEAAIKLWLGLS